MIGGIVIVLLAGASLAIPLLVWRNRQLERQIENLKWVAQTFQ